MNIFYIDSISIDGMHFIPLSTKGVIASIVFELPGTRAELIAAVDTEKKFNAKYEYKDIDGKVRMSNTYQLKLRLMTDTKNNLLLGTETVGYHTEINIEDFRRNQ